MAATAVSPADATVTIYTSQLAYDAAVTSGTTFGFDEGDSANHFHFIDSPYTQSGIAFADNPTSADAANGGTPGLVLIGNAATPNYGVDFLSFQNTDVGISGTITTPGVTAFGFNYATYVAAGPATVSVDGGAPTAIAVTGTPTFIGFTSDAPISNVNILFPTAYSFDLTSVSYGTAIAAAPEPAAWAMTIAGFGLVGCALRRRPSRVGVRTA